MDRVNRSNQTESRDNGDENRDSRGVRRWTPLQYGIPHPMDMLRRYSQEMDRVFDNFGFSGLMGRWPAIEMCDRDNQMVIRAELPGVKREDVHVRVVGDQVVIEGERRQQRDDRRDDVHRSEWSYGRFSREIPMSSDLDVTKLTARMEDGVLELTVPYKEERKHREIQIQGGQTSETSTVGSRR